ncbi:hypothetical protein WJX73_007055 [Symbiochloris irregularis]|uniref:Uncharacterized protein n=1 Tax=Symbiochloris irregularis TaxID=706552 RepID=A0AAW1NZ75_9CHLO
MPVGPPGDVVTTAPLLRWSPGTSLETPDTSRKGSRELYKWLVDDLPWSRLGVWLAVAWTAFQLKDFFGIFMGTFILAFVGNSFVRSAQQTRLLSPFSPLLRRRTLVLIYFTFILGVVSMLGIATMPDIIREGADFITRLQSDNIWVVVLEKARSGLGDGVMDQIERLMLVASGDELGSMRTSAAVQAWTPERTQYLGTVLHRMLRSYTDSAVNLTTNLLAVISRFAVQVGVSMILSFMIVYDLPNISAGASSLRTSRLAPFYNELAPILSVFGQLFGKALQAQARIAMANTGLTAMGMWCLAIPGKGLLSLFVFICSFIPIAGCFISTVPIAFVALTEYGFLQLGLVILMVFGIHMIEAYGLNPAIYSAHLKLHPLLVLSVLVMAEHTLGVWGLLLAVPMTVFTLDYCIRYPACTVTEIAAKELKSVDFSDSMGSGGEEYVAPFKKSQDLARYQRVSLNHNDS